MISAQELLDRADFVGDPAGRWPHLMLVMVAELLATPVPLPAQLADVLDDARAYWQGDDSRREDVEVAHVACWKYLEQKHGNSVAIVDDEDRLIRASLCVLQPERESVQEAADRAEWLCDMLNGIDR